MKKPIKRHEWLYNVWKPAGAETFQFKCRIFKCKNCGETSDKKIAARCYGKKKKDNLELLRTL